MNWMKTRRNISLGECIERTLRNSGLFVILFFTPFYIHAQKVKLWGTISTSKGEIVPFTYVMSEDKTVMSDEKGDYEIKLEKGIHTLRISSIGFKPKIIITDSLTDDIKLDIVLTDSLQTLQTIVVTSSVSKKEEDILKAPAAVTVLSAEKIKNSNTNGLEDMRGMIPNYQYGNLGVSYQQQVSIRGISVFSETPTVATYIDGVNAMDISANGLQLMDVERIEVLKGPQGTLYGRNAMGGVINIYTKKPQNRTSGFLRTEVGNQGLQRHGFAFSTPLRKDTLLFGISGQYKQLNGFYTNDLSDQTTFLHTPLKGHPTDGKRYGDEASIYVNTHLKWWINEKMELLWNGKYQTDYSTGPSSYFQAAESYEVAIESPYAFNVTHAGSHKRQVYNTSLSLTYDKRKYKVQNTLALQHVKQAYNNIDYDLYSYDLGYGASYHKKLGKGFPQTVWSNETRISSNEENSELEWTVGTYFFAQNYKKSEAVVYKRLALLFGEDTGTFVTQNHMLNMGAALFGQGQWNITPTWAFIAGMRFDYEHKNADINRFQVKEDNNMGNSTIDTNRSAEFYAWTPKLVLSKKWTENHFTYLSYAKGYRAGGINYFSNREGYESYNPEFSDNIELGHKWSSRDRKFMLTSAFFLMNWKDLQLDMQVEQGGSWVVDNIGDVHAMGVEIESSYTPFKSISIDYSLGLNDSHYQGFEYLGQDIKGNQTIFAPKITSSLALQTKIPITKEWKILMRGEWRYLGEQYFDLLNTIPQEPIHLLNGNIGVNYKQWELAFWIKNILDERYVTFAMPGYFTNTLLNRPQTSGVSLRYHF